MRSFAVLASLVVLSAAARVDAQSAEDPPAPLEPEAPPPAVAPLAPDPLPPTPPPDAPAASSGCALWPIALSGAAFEGGSLAIGGLLFCVGGLMASIDPTPTSSDCGQACAEAVFSVFVIAVGIVVAGVGLVVLGPVAAIAVTVSMALAAAAAGRTMWPAVVGGSVGIVGSVLGAGLVIWGVTNAQTVPFVAAEPLHLSDAPHLALVTGIGLLVTAGLVSLGAGLSLDVAFGSQAAEAEPEDGAVVAQAPVRPALRAPRVPTIVHAQAW